jgi:MscS family membrane protein
VASENIDNLGKRGVRRILFFLGITCETPPDKIEQFLSGIIKLLEANPKVRRGDFTAHLFDLKSDNLELRVEFYLQVSALAEERREREKILLEILSLAKLQAIEFAYPTRTLHMVGAEA